MIANNLTLVFIMYDLFNINFIFYYITLSAKKRLTVLIFYKIQNQKIKTNSFVRN